MAFSKKGKKEAARAASVVAPAASELAASQLYAEDPLEALLDEQSNEEFGDLELKDRAGKPVKLAEWTAQDFSSIYVRFRPHLERHARRFLNNPSQVDEVVQDAFLYLMVSLPELDSEIGVLRFLKWKTRLLALDVIRASGRAYINSIDDVPEPESLDPEVSSSLERQDDAAVVKLALSKLNPRHREVLIASMYEEKSTEQIAAQVGLSENATRQLIFRARAAFKKAFVGDVDTTGMSAAAILSVAARKAAAEGKKVGAAALTIIALVVMSLTVFPGLNRTPADQMASNPESPTSVDSGPAAIEVLPTPENGIVDDGNETEVFDESGEAGAEVAQTPEPADGSSANATTVSNNQKNASGAAVAEIDEAAEKIFDSRASRSQLLVLDEKYSATNNQGVTATFSFNPTKDQPFIDVAAHLDLDDVLFSVYPDKSEWLMATDSAGVERYIYFGSMKYVFDEFGKVWEESKLAQGTLRIDVVMDSNRVTVKDVFITVLSK